AVRGKIAYMAPEQADARSLDHRADVFSLGIVLWEAITGDRLFHAGNEVATLRKVMACEIPAPSKVKPDLPRSLDTICLHALARKPVDRFPDALSLRLALEDFLHREHLQASSAHLTAYVRDVFPVGSDTSAPVPVVLEPEKARARAVADLLELERSASGAETQLERPRPARESHTASVSVAQVRERELTKAS